jgi:hypothetical protein
MIETMRKVAGLRDGYGVKDLYGMDETAGEGGRPRELFNGHVPRPLGTIETDDTAVGSP